MYSTIRLRPLGLVLALAILGACEPQNAGPSAGRFGFDAFSIGGVAGSQSASTLATTGGRSSSPEATTRGTDTFINTEALRTRTGKAEVIPVGAGTVELSLVDASIPAAAKAVLGEALGKNYVVEDGLSGHITLRTTGAIPKTSLLDLFSSALAANDAQLETDGDIVKVVRGTSGARAFRMAQDGVGSSGSILVAPLKYISAGEMAALLEPLVGEGLSVKPDPSRNLLLLSGEPSALEASLDALNLFDVDVMQGKSVALVSLNAAEPEDVAEELRNIFAAQEGGALKDVIQFVPNDRLGSVLIISSRASYMDKAKRWVRELDQGAAQGKMILRTYPLHNRTANEVAPILNGLFGGSPSDTVSPETLTSAAESGGAAFMSSDGAMLPRVAADNARNALIVLAEGSDHTEITAILRNLDTVAKQVMLEATIAEVTLNDEVNVGTRWFFERGNWDFMSTDLSSSTISGNAPGFSAVFNAGGASMALSALASVTDVKVISSPTLVVVDNHKGVLQIGDQVPIATQTSSATDETAIATTQVEYRDTGIILTVLPRIGAGGRVSLDITQEVSDVSATRTSGIDSPTISTRKVETSVVLADGQTLALGGLVQESDNKTRSQVPGIGDVPVLGTLFGSRNSKKQRTELLIMIRPRVVYDPVDAASVTASWRNKLGQTSGILQTGLGPGRHSVSEVLR